jgi:DNA-binding XRE family transcriptional regulator
MRENNGLRGANTKEAIVAEGLKAIRLFMGMTQQELAFAIGIRRDSYKDFETGKRSIPLWLIKRVEQIQCEQSLS